MCRVVRGVRGVVRRVVAHHAGGRIVVAAAVASRRRSGLLRRGGRIRSAVICPASPARLSFEDRAGNTVETDIAGARLRGI